MEPISDVSVLVVDDQAPFRFAARATLARTPGFTFVGEAVDGCDAVEAAETSDADLVLMDVNMPVMDGITATRALLSTRPSTIIFLCSTYSLEELPASALDSGARGYVNKEDLSPELLRLLWAAVVAAGPDGGLLTG